jgi:hypothetical protein
MARTLCPRLYPRRPAGPRRSIRARHTRRYATAAERASRKVPSEQIASRAGQIASASEQSGRNVQPIAAVAEQVAPHTAANWAGGAALCSSRRADRCRQRSTLGGSCSVLLESPGRLGGAQGSQLQPIALIAWRTRHNGRRARLNRRRTRQDAARLTIGARPGRDKYRTGGPDSPAAAAHCSPAGATGPAAGPACCLGEARSSAGGAGCLAGAARGWPRLAQKSCTAAWICRRRALDSSGGALSYAGRAPARAAAAARCPRRAAPAAARGPSRSSPQAAARRIREA